MPPISFEFFPPKTDEQRATLESALPRLKAFKPEYDMSDGPIVLLVLLVLTQMPDWFVAALRFGGGFFLLFLAYKAYRSAREMMGTVVAELPTPKKQSIREAALMNMLSPNAYLFWSTIAGPIFLEGWRQAPSHGLAFMLGFYGALIGGFMSFVVLFGILGQASARLNRVLGFVTAVALFGFGLYQIWLGAQRFLG